MGMGILRSKANFLGILQPVSTGTFQVSRPKIDMKSEKRTGNSHLAVSIDFSRYQSQIAWASDMYALFDSRMQGGVLLEQQREPGLLTYIFSYREGDLYFNVKL